MASIINRPNGHRWIQFTDRDGKRKTIRLGKCDAKAAALISTHVEALVSRTLTGESIEAKTALWLADAGDTMHDRLAAVGLVEAREVKAGQSITVAKLIDDYSTRRDDVKPNTRLVWVNARRHLVAFFGVERKAGTINAAEAKDFHRYLLKNGSEAYASTLLRRCRMFFADGVERGYFPTNPFVKIKLGSVKNKANQRYIDAGTIAKVIEACPDSQWRLIVALSRFAGLRCPSEHLALKWSDIDFEKGRMRVPVAKLERFADKAVRIVPIFPALRPYLLEAFEQAGNGDVYVITRYRTAGINLRTQLERILVRAGVTQWPRLFHNLRASCQTDLARDFPAHVVCEWIGNSEAVARDHYLQVTEADFEKASQPEAKSEAVGSRNGSQGVEVKQFANKKSPGIAERFETMRNTANFSVRHVGLEPTTR